jgi:hypothetical protein
VARTGRWISFVIILAFRQSGKDTEEDRRRDNRRKDVEHSVDRAEAFDEIPEEIVEKPAQERSRYGDDCRSPELSGEGSAKQVHVDKRQYSANREIRDSDCEIQH